MQSFEYHEIATILPMLPDEELQSLAADIKARGLNHSITIFESKILDGRNRFRACEIAGVEPTFTEFTGTQAEAIEHVWSENVHRRHLSSSQAAACLIQRLKLEDSYREQEEALKSAARERQEATLPEKGQKGFQANVSQSIDSHCDNRNERKTDAILAKSVNTNRTFVAEARKLSENAPDKFEAIIKGEKTIPQAVREIKEAAREERRAANRALVEEARTPAEAVGTAKFATIVIDPPWDWGDEGDCDQLGRSRPTYSTMPIEEIMALPVGKLADEDCHIYLWITNRSLPKGFGLLDAWGFRYITCLTWAKPSFGLGNYFRGSTEQILFGVKGSQPLRRKDVGTWFQAPRGPNGHSSKPLAFFELVESCSPGPYLEMFARSGRDGWISWGAEA